VLQAAVKAAGITVTPLATVVPVVAKPLAADLGQGLLAKVTMAVQPHKVILRTQLAAAVKTQRGQLATRT
jgi:hypothetical protein